MAGSCTADLLVVGGGPAGTAAAIVGSRLGLDVVLHDRAAFPRDKTCGDGLTVAALRELEALGLHSPATVPGWFPVRNAVLAGPGAGDVHLPLPDDGTFVAVAPRRELDAALVDMASSAGARVRQRSAATALSLDGAVVARFSDGAEVRARYVVAADGMFSTVRKLVTPGRPPYLGEMHAFRQYFEGVDDDRMWVLLEPDLLPGYFWVFPLPGGRANVGFGIHRGDGARTGWMNRLWHDLLRRPRVRRVLGGARPVDARRAWPIPAALAPGDLAFGRVLFAGDAAAAADPLTGEGIAQALHMGEAAARAVARGLDGNGDGSALVRDAYVEAVTRDLVPDHRLSRALLRVLRRPAGARAALGLTGSTGWTRRHFARWMFEDYPRAVLLTPRRWRRGALGGPGAYRAPSA